MEGDMVFLAAAFSACWALGVVPWVGVRAAAAAAVPGGLLALGLGRVGWASPLLGALEGAVQGGLAAARWAFPQETGSQP